MTLPSRSRRTNINKLHRTIGRITNQPQRRPLTNTTQRAGADCGTYAAPDRQAAATLRANQEDNKNHVRLHRRGLHNRLPIKLLQDNEWSP